MNKEQMDMKKIQIGISQQWKTYCWNYGSMDWLNGLDTNEEVNKLKIYKYSLEYDQEYLKIKRVETEEQDETV